METDEFWTAKELADRWKTTTMALAQQRHRDLGPPYVKVSKRWVLYRKTDILAYESGNTKQVAAE